MAQLIKLLIFGTLITITASCQNKQQKIMEGNIIQKKTNLPQFEWKANVNCPVGYPVEVYRGGLEGNNAYVSLDSGTATGIGGWGDSGADVSYGVKALPNRINCIWVSYAEGCLYSIDAAIDYEKMLKLFEEGYQDSGAFYYDKGTYKKRTYSTIIAGFAPGGVVVVWVMGPGMQVEIGHYKGEKYEVPEKEIARLDAHESLLFSKDEYKRIMLNTRIVPPEVREANAGKPIPFGLWDSYRVRYIWRPIFQHREIIEITSIYCKMINGERETWFDKSLQENKFTKRGILKSAYLTWTDWTKDQLKDPKGQGYAAKIAFDNDEITRAYEEIYKDDTEGKVEIRFGINYTQDFVTVQLTKGDKEVRLVKTKVETYKGKNLSIRK